MPLTSGENRTLLILAIDSFMEIILYEFFIVKFSVGLEIETSFFILQHEKLHRITE